MITDSIYFRGHRCFKKEWAGFDKICPVNVIIGRNNTGKSHLLDLVSAICASSPVRDGWQYRFRGKLDEPSLRRYFNPNTTGGELGGHHWSCHGSKFVNIDMMWESDGQGSCKEFTFPDDFQFESPYGQQSTHARRALMGHVAASASHKLAKSNFRRLLADRDIRPEGENNSLLLGDDGQGATSIIRRYMVSSSTKYPRELIQVELREALNEIFRGDGEFNEIEVKVHDDDELEPGIAKGYWEVFLGEQSKGLVSLSRSGSGLKTIILVLLNLLVIPKLQGHPKSSYVYAFEELENNLHPALLRRLFQYLEKYATQEKAAIFLTTHSSVALDLFGMSANAQIIHVTHDGESAKAQTVSAHFDHLSVISELGAKPSDLLQANGIIWVEGPSDRIYVNRWIDLVSEGKFKEGRDYQCAFYGGALLARTQFTSPADAEAELVNLFCVNPNIVVMCDGDRPAQRSRVKDRVRRIRAEVRRIPGAHVWVTTGRDIENYIPGSVLAKALQHTRKLPDPGQYEPFFPRKGMSGKSYIERRLGRKSLDKVELAVLCAPHMDALVMKPRFDWEAQIKSVLEKVQKWNE